MLETKLYGTTDKIRGIVANPRAKDKGNDGEWVDDSKSMKATHKGLTKELGIKNPNGGTMRTRWLLTWGGIPHDIHHKGSDVFIDGNFFEGIQGKLFYYYHIPEKNSEEWHWKMNGRRYSQYRRLLATDSEGGSRPKDWKGFVYRGIWFPDHKRIYIQHKFAFGAVNNGVISWPPTGIRSRDVFGPDVFAERYSLYTGYALSFVHGDKTAYQFGQFDGTTENGEKTSDVLCIDSI